MSRELTSVHCAEIIDELLGLRWPTVSNSYLSLHYEPKNEFNRWVVIHNTVNGGDEKIGAYISLKTALRIIETETFQRTMPGTF